MMQRCSYASCFAHDGETCPFGTRNLAECPHWWARSPGPRPPRCPARCQPGCPGRLAHWACQISPAWSHEHAPSLIGILGAHDAGKTTLLTGNYLELLRGKSLASARFAGSRTLQAWESLAAWVRFDNAARKPSFPTAHPSTSRVPVCSTSHCKRGPRDEFRDVLLTNTPGRWSPAGPSKKMHPTQRARDGWYGTRMPFWCSRTAVAWIAIAPNEAKPGKIFVSSWNAWPPASAKGPTALVWAKADQKPNEGIREQEIRRALKVSIPHATEVESSTRATRGERSYSLWRRIDPQ